MRIPYGKSNFAELRRGGYVYADKTGFIAKLEDATKGRHYLGVRGDLLPLAALLHGPPDVQEEAGRLRLGIPNYAVRTLYWETIAHLLQDLHRVDMDTNGVVDALEAMSRDGDMGPFLRLVFTKVIRKLSNRDLIRLDEKTMKVVLLAYLSLSDELFAWSEVELGFGYGDLVLLPSRLRPVSAFAFVLELKYLKAGATGEAVLARLDEADAQLQRYLADEKLHAMAGGRPWKAVSIAFVGTEACWLRELGGETQEVEA